MPDVSSILSLPLLMPSQAQKHVTHNEALALLDALVQTVAQTRDSTSPPALPDPGECHIVPTGATGDWAGQAGNLAVHDNAAWRFITPRPGWRAYVAAEAAGVVWDGSAWVADLPGLDNLDGIGIGTSHDTVNRLAVASEASLLTHAGAGHQLKINKSAAADTASLLFQTGWSGRAEMGTAGSDGFEIKLSADGSAWTTALGFDPASGIASGAAIQQSADDITAGRLMRADYGYGPGNLLGTVSQSGGTPTGAVIERGSNANGEFCRMADGAQFCQAEVTLAYVNGAICTANWTFPAAFAAGSQPLVTGSISANSLLANAPSVTANQVTGLTLGALSTTSAALQIRTLSGYAFSTGETVVQRVIALGRWF